MVKKLKQKFARITSDGIEDPAHFQTHAGEPALIGEFSHHEFAKEFWRGHPDFRIPTIDDTSPVPRAVWMFAYADTMAMITDPQGQYTKARVRELKKKASVSYVNAEAAFLAERTKP